MEEFSPKYKLGLSATPEREGDEEGTSKTNDYFNKILQNYLCYDRDALFSLYFRRLPVLR